MSTKHRPGGHGKLKECECGETKDLIYYGSAWQCPNCARINTSHFETDKIRSRFIEKKGDSCNILYQEPYHVSGFYYDPNHIS